VPGDAFEEIPVAPAREITQERKAHPVSFTFRRSGGLNTSGSKANGVDCVALDNSVSADWRAAWAG